MSAPPTASASAPRPATRSGRLAARIVWLVASLLALTLRWRWVGGSERWRPGPSDQFIVAIWHNRLALSLLLYHRYVTRPFPGRRLAALVSASRDGGILARILELFRVHPIRGSSSRRGAQALRELVTAAGEGYDLAVTPDGPRGPCYEVQEGVLLAAQLTGLPLLPVSYRLGWKVTLNSWDRFQIPLPFSTVEIELAEPIHIAREGSAEARRLGRETLQNRLRSITRD